MARRVLILGGGAGGAVAARRLAQLARRGEVEVTVIDRSPYHEFRPSYLWVMMGLREPDEVRRPLSRLEGYGVRFVRDEVVSIDPGDRVVRGRRGSYAYDYLVVALGAETYRDGALGDACSPWELEWAVKCREALRGFRGRRIVVGHSTPVYRCPPAPFEVAFMLRYLAWLRGLEGVEVTVFHSWGKPMEPFGPQMVKAFTEMMERYGVGFVGGAGLDHVDPSRRVVVLSNGERLRYDLAVIAPPHRPPKPVAGSDELADPRTGYMRVVLPRLRHPRYDDVFGIGDAVAPTLGLGMAGVFAHFQAEYVVTQILDEVRGAFMGSDYNMSGVCELDLGFTGAMVYCDFAPKLMGRSPYPECRMLGGLRAFRGAKIVFEKVWFATLFGG